MSTYYEDLSRTTSAYNDIASYEDNANADKLDEAKSRLLQHIVKIVNHLEPVDEEDEQA